MNILGMKIGSGAELDAVLIEAAEAEKTRGHLRAKREKCYKKLSTLNRELGATAYEALREGGDRAPYEKLEADIAQTNGQIQILDHAIGAADEKISEALARVNAAKRAEKARTCRRLLNKRKRSITDIQGALCTLAYAYPEAFNTNDELMQLFDVLTVPEGTMLTIREIEAAAARELLRLTKPDPIKGPFVPGAARDLLVNPTEITPLLEDLEQADNAILKALEPTAEPVKPYGHGAEAERDPATMTNEELLEGLGQILEPDVDSDLLGATTMTEAQAMSLLPKTQNFTIDHRANKGDGR